MNDFDKIKEGIRMANEMAQTNEQQAEPQSKTEQVCTVNIACIVASDDEALALKQRITDAVKGIAKKRVSFTLTDGTIPPLNRMPGT